MFFQLSNALSTISFGPIAIQKRKLEFSWQFKKNPTKMDKITQFSQKIEKTANFMNFRYFIEEKIFFNENSNCWFSATYSPKGTREHALESSR